VVVLFDFVIAAQIPVQSETVMTDKESGLTDKVETKSVD
jgi:hypothetical protein